MSKHVAVLMGGWSSERQVSLWSGEACAKALEGEGFRVTRIDVGRDLPAVIASVKPDVAFNALHGRFGEDGTVQGLLEVMGVPYTHSGVLASSLAMHKERAKTVMAAAGVSVPRGKVVTRAEAAAGHVLTPPYVLKPVDGGSSVGVLIVNEDHAHPPQELNRDDWSHGELLLAENFVAGKELTCAVLNGEALDVIEILPTDGWYDFEAKYAKGGSKHVLPAEISPFVYQQVRKLAVAAHDALGCRGVSRADFRFDDREGGTGELVCLEVNTQPGMTETSLVPELAAYAGMGFGELVKWLVEDASLRSIDEPSFTAGPGRAPRNRPAPTLIYKTDPNMRATHEGARPRRPVIEEFDDMMGASRATNFRLKLARLIRKRRLGFGLVVVFYAGVGVLGMIDGGHWPMVEDEILNAHVTTANALGFQVVAVQTEGQSALTDDEILLALGIKEDTALPFLDVKAARERLMANPLVAEATVRKLYPDRVTVHLTERKPFALWQHDGKVQILAADGTAIDEFHDSRFAHLPLVVGPSANLKAERLLEALDAAPKIKAETYAAVLVAERRWNLRLRSGVEVKLPETGFAEALARLETLQENENLLSKWIDVVDLREPDRTIVRLSEEAAASVAEEEKAAAKTKKKGGQT